jgi:hypothetical protein
MAAFYDPGVDWHAEQERFGTVAAVVEADVGRTVVEVVAAMLLLQEYPTDNPSAALPTFGEHSNRRPTRQTHGEHMGIKAHPGTLHGHKVSIPHSDGPHCVMPVHANRSRSDRSIMKGALAHGWEEAHALLS